MTLDDVLSQHIAIVTLNQIKNIDKFIEFDLIIIIYRFIINKFDYWDK
jgi:hypothetical protein